MSSLDPVSIQKDEVTALRSIFEKEFKLFRPKNMKKNYEPPNLSIQINIDPPLTGGIKYSLKINFDCSADYPLSTPKISITDALCIPTEIQDELLTDLTQKSLPLKGAPMIHNLVEEAREILLSKIGKRKSEKSVQNENDILQAENKESVLKLQLLRQRQNSAMIETKKEKKIEKCFHAYKNHGVEQFSHCSDETALQVYKGLCEGDHRVKSIGSTQQLVFNVFQGFCPTKGSTVRIHQISLLSISKKRFDYLQLHWLPKLEHDFSRLYRLSHPNLLPILALRVHTHEKQIRKKKHVDVNIQYVTPNCGEVKLSTLCEIDVKTESGDNCGPKLRVPIHKIKIYLKSVLDVVFYLHENHVTHIKINIDSILVDKGLQLKISYYQIGERLQELKENEKKEETCEDDLPAVSSIKKGSRRHDLLKVGKLAKQLYFYGVPKIEIDESEMPPDLIDFILCLESNIEDVNRHPFLCAENADTVKSYDQNNSASDKQGVNPWKPFEESSRIPKEFEPICKLGEGAFGDVLKVKNIFDNQYYAIKRVRLNTIKKKTERAMKEVQLLSSLNHENIVRYYASWAEEISIGDQNLQPKSSFQDQDDSTSTRNNISDARSVRKAENVDSILLDIPSTRNRFQLSRSFNILPLESRSRHFDLESYSDSSDSESESQTDEELIGRKSVDIIFEDSNEQQQQSSKPYSKYVNNAQYKKNRSNKAKIERYLMIQMELCEGPWNTLQKCIDGQKLYANEKLIWRFIREIVSGLEHIHSKNMIHRDLKPHNIFIDHQKRVKIGDLGLAMNIGPKIIERVTTEGNEERALSNDTREKGPVGTLMYISPEMMSNILYTNKTDMYSLGVIVFEMCHKPFNTSSERYHLLGNIRKSNIIFPDERHFKMKAPFKQLIESLLDHDPSRRPSASELLRSSIIPPPEGREMELRRFLTEVTKTSSSNLYKFMVEELFSQLYSKDGRYELPLLYQLPFKYYLSNTKAHLIHMLANHSRLEMDQGDYTFFTMKRLVTRYIESVFITHGAVEFTPPLLSPNVFKGYKHVFSLLDSEGVVVNLPDNLRVNFANFLLNNRITSTKRYAIGVIYQQQEYRRDHPRELIEAAFDIVTDYKNSNKYIEILYVLHQIFSKLLNFEHVTLNLEINHTDLFFGLMNYYKIPEELHQRILSSLQDKGAPEVDYLDTDEFRKCSTLNDTQLANLKSALRYNGRLDEYEKLLKISQNKGYENDCCESIMGAINELKSIERKLANFPDNFCFSVNLRPKVIPSKSIYRGFVFQVTLQFQDRFFDLVKPSSSKNNKLTIKYLRNLSMVKLSTGGEYSSYLMAGTRSFVGEDGNIFRCVSALGASIDMSTLLQCVYSMEQLISFNADADYQYNSLMNSVVSVVVQYDVDNDKIIWELLAKLWAAGLSAELYDKDSRGEEYFFNHNINFFVEFQNKYDKKSHNDNRIIVKKNDCKGVGLEQISGDDTRTTIRVVELILKESKKTKDNFINRLEKENANIMVQRQTSEILTPDLSVELDVKKCFISKPESQVNQYTYKFVTTKDGKFSSDGVKLSYFVETNKHIHSLSQKHADLDSSQIQAIVKLNCQLNNTNKWFQGRFPNPLYCIIAELTHSKCLSFIEEVSLKSLKDSNKLSKIFVKIESLKNYSNEKQWKDVLSRVWEALQDAVKEKIFRVLIYCQIDEHFVFLDIK